MICSLVQCQIASLRMQWWVHFVSLKNSSLLIRTGSNRSIFNCILRRRFQVWFRFPVIIFFHCDPLCAEPTDGYRVFIIM